MLKIDPLRVRLTGASIEQEVKLGALMFGRSLAKNLIILSVVCAGVIFLAATVRAQTKQTEGEALLRSGEFIEAVNVITASIKNGELSKTRLAIALGQRAYAWQELGEFELSRDDLNRAIDLEPYDAWLYSRRCWTNASLKNLFSAKSDCDRAMWLLTEMRNVSNTDVDQILAAIHNARAEIFYRQAKFDSAITEYSKALNIFEIKSIYENRGNAKAAVGDFAGAIDDYTKTIDLSGDKDFLLAEIRWKRGQAYYNLDELRSAAADFSSAVSINPTEPRYLNDHCWVYSVLEEPEVAVGSCDKAVVIDPFEYIYWDSRAFAYYQLKQFDVALDSVKRALEISPKSRWSIYHKIKIKKSIGDFSGVIEDVRLLKKISPNWPAAQPLYEKYLK